MADDSLMDLEFNEDWWSKGAVVKGFHYNIQHGEMNWAYNYGPSLENFEVSLKTHVNLADADEDNNSLIIDKKDTLWHYSEPELIANRERDKRASLFYEPMLLKSVDELYDMLFKKE
jgi:hypothetical protein